MQRCSYLIAQYFSGNTCVEYLPASLTNTGFRDKCPCGFPLQYGTVSVQQRTPDIARMLECLNTALRLNPKHSANAYKWLSWAKQRTGDVQGAIEDVSTAIIMQPKEARFYAIRADLNQQHGDLQGALDDIGLALQFAEASADTLVYNALRADYLTEKYRRDSLAARRK